MRDPHDTTDLHSATSSSGLPRGSERGPTLASLVDRALAGGRGREQAGAEQALAALTLLRDLREWTLEVEPRAVDLARRRGVTWEQIAPHVGVADRRAAQARRRRQDGSERY